MNTLVGLNNNSNRNKEENVLSTKIILDGVSSLMSSKMPLSDDILILCSIYSKYCDNNSKYVNLVINTIIECLNGKIDNFKTQTQLRQDEFDLIIEQASMGKKYSLFDNKI